LKLDSACDIARMVNRYAYRAEWSRERDEYVSRCIELPWLEQWAPTLQEATAAAQRAVDEYVAEQIRDGGEVPTPLNERRYTGKFMVRTSPELHARLALEAADSMYR
jgi:predicted RNase H-like HicB family nuclease